MLFAAVGYRRENRLADRSRIVARAFAQLTKTRRIDRKRIDGAEQLVFARDGRVIELPRGLWKRACRFDDAMRSVATRVWRGRRDHETLTAIPPRSNGVESTTVVLVRATPLMRFTRPSKSSRCPVERVTVFIMKLSSPATLCT